MEHILPIYIPGEDLVNGLGFTTYEFCNRRVAKPECVEHYKSIFKTKKTGFYICPEGVTSYYDKVSDTIYTSILVQDHVNKKRIIRNQKHHNFMKNPYIFDEERFLEMVKQSRMMYSNLKTIKHYESNLDCVIHDMKYYLTKLSDIYEKNRSYFGTKHVSKAKMRGLKSYLLSIGKLVEGLKTTFNNQSVLELEQVYHQSSIIPINVYDILHKHKMIKRNSQNFEDNIIVIKCKCENVTVQVRKYFRKVIDGIIDNAEKYLPQGEIELRYSQIVCEISECKDYIYVSVESYGPLVDKDEEKSVFESQFRGRHVNKNKYQGSGLGLATVKKYCAVDEIDVECSSDTTRPFISGNGTFYPFKITLSIKKLKE